MIEPTQEEFMGLRLPWWNRLDGLLQDMDKLSRPEPAAISELAALYRALCGDLMVVRARGYAPDLVDYLNALAARASGHLYRPRKNMLPGFWETLTRSFPQVLRRRVGFFAIATALFVIPAAIGLFGALYWDGFAQRVLPSGQLAVVAQMYADGFDVGRSEAIDTMMFGHYVQNNIGIAFRCFATGILFGLGSIYFLLYNGLTIGTTIGFVIAAGGGTNILTFICSHGPFELTAIVIAGGAGLQMGWSLVETHGRTRLGSLRAQAAELVALVTGAGGMLAIAAILEAFWSPSGLPPQVKWASSAVFSLALIAFFIWGGRDPADTEANACS